MFTINYNHAIMYQVTKVTKWSPILAKPIFIESYKTYEALI
ncbi:hypothetical protein [Listeria booriae]|nr:hypothetical protein [Listeria booriae]